MKMIGYQANWTRQCPIQHSYTLNPLTPFTRDVCCVEKDGEPVGARPAGGQQEDWQDHPGGEAKHGPQVGIAVTCSVDFKSPW